MRCVAMKIPSTYYKTLSTLKLSPRRTSVAVPTLPILIAKIQSSRLPIAFEQFISKDLREAFQRVTVAFRVLYSTCFKMKNGISGQRH